MPRKRMAQRRGAGKPRYRAPSHRWIADVGYRSYDAIEKSGAINGKVIDLIHDPGRSAPLMLIRYENGEEIYLPAPVGIKVGDAVECGALAHPSIGNVLPLKAIPEGSLIYNLELVPGDGGKLIRGAGCFARVMKRGADKVIVMLPSRKIKYLNPECRATIGVIAGAGRLERPLLKAGKAYYVFRIAKHGLWPRVAAVAMNPIDHPLGGGKRRRKKTLVVGRRAPAKYGAIAPRR